MIGVAESTLHLPFMQTSVVAVLFFFFLFVFSFCFDFCFVLLTQTNDEQHKQTFQTLSNADADRRKRSENKRKRKSRVPRGVPSGRWGKTRARRRPPRRVKGREENATGEAAGRSRPRTPGTSPLRRRCAAQVGPNGGERRHRPARAGIANTLAHPLKTSTHFRLTQKTHHSTRTHIHSRTHSSRRAPQCPPTPPRRSPVVVEFAAEWRGGVPRGVALGALPALPALPRWCCCCCCCCWLGVADVGVDAQGA